MPYRVEYSPEAADHLLALPARDRVTILDSVSEQLTHQPLIQTRNRKPMRPNRLATWELCVGALRVYYEVYDDPEPVVHVRAVGIKRRDRMEIGGEEIDL